LKTELVIFDCDGVLVDSELVCNSTLVEFVSEFGLSLDLKEALVLFKGCKMADCVSLIEQRLGQPLPSDFVAQLRSRIASAYEQDLKPITGIKGVLESLDLPICVASNGPVHMITLALQVTDLLPYFQGHIFSSYQVNQWKPEPHLFLHAASIMGVLPSECAVVEDSVLGVRAGVAAGMRVFGYAEHSEAKQLESCGAHVFNSMYQLPSLLMS
jgi:HAD superfamily hydrolase (TIGR01509 family)